MQTNPDRTWHLTAESSDDAAAWAQLLTQAVQGGGRTGSTTALGLADSEDDDSMPEDEEEQMVGNDGVWLVKQGTGALASPRRRYCVLAVGLQSRRPRLVYYAGMRDGYGQNRKGAVPLGPASVIEHSDDCITVVRGCVGGHLAPVVSVVVICVVPIIALLTAADQPRPRVAADGRQQCRSTRLGSTHASTAGPGRSLGWPGPRCDCAARL